MIASAAADFICCMNLGFVCVCMCLCVRLAWWVLLLKSGAHPPLAPVCTLSSAVSCVLHAAGLQTGRRRMMTDRFTYPKSGRSTQRHTHGPVCHFLISCCSVLKPLLPLCGEWTLCSFLFVMLITLSLTVPHFSCQLAFILPPPLLLRLSFPTVYRQPSRGAFKSLPASLVAPGTNYISRVLFNSYGKQGQTETSNFYLCQQHRTFSLRF